MELLVFKKYGMKIRLNQVNAIIGPANSGKTTVFKLLANRVNNDSVYLDKKRLNDYKISFLKRNIMVVFEFDDFNTEYVKEELAYYLQKLGYDKELISSRVAEITHYFNIDDLVEYKIDYLNVEEKCFIKLLSFLICNPKVFGVDNLFSYLSNKKVELVMEYVSKNGISLIYTSTDAEKLIYANEIFVIDKFRCVKSGAKGLIFKDKIVKDLKLSLPFMVELNEYLKDYELIDQEYDTVGKCVGALWK